LGKLLQKFMAIVALIASSTKNVRAQQTARPADIDLAAITARGRALAAYDQAAWHATDAVQTANPKTAQGQHYLARFENDGWMVVFGYLNPDKTKFLITYETTQDSKHQVYKVSHNDPPKEDAGYFLFAARALEAVLSDFGRPSRPYNSAVLTAADNQLYVYLYPAQLKAGVYPLGGDVRYLVSADGRNILEKRQLHKSIIEPTAAPSSAKKAGGNHIHAGSDFPEDTDVLHVLQQDPHLPEIVNTPHFTYEIMPDGSIRIRREKKK
jgi:hypothetical protein